MRGTDNRKALYGRLLMGSLTCIVVGAVVILTWMIPSSRYTMDVFAIPLRYVWASLDTVLFVLMLGGFLGLVKKTKALELLCIGPLRTLKQYKLWLIPFVMLLFAVGGTLYGVSSRIIVWQALAIILLMIVRIETLTSVVAIVLATGIGVIGSVVNPYLTSPETTVRSVDVISLFIQSGMLIALLVALIGLVVNYATQIGLEEERSARYQTAITPWNHEARLDKTAQRYAVIGIVFAAMIGMFLLMFTRGNFWELTGLFAVAALLIVAVYYHEYQREHHSVFWFFVEGIRDILGLVFVIVMIAIIGITIDHGTIELKPWDGPHSSPKDGKSPGKKSDSTKHDTPKQAQEQQDKRDKRYTKKVKIIVNNRSKRRSSSQKPGGQSNSTGHKKRGDDTHRGIVEDALKHARVGEILKIAVVDPDGVPAVGIHYQWYADEQAIQGAVFEAYRIRPDDVGKKISVQARYTDNAGNHETTDRLVIADIVDTNPMKISSLGNKVYPHKQFGKYIDARDFGVDPARPDNTTDLKAALKAADDEDAALYLGPGTLKIHEQIRIGKDVYNRAGTLIKEGYENVVALFGAGTGNTTVTFDWQQEGNYNPSKNVVDAMTLGGILIDSVNDKTIADLTVNYLPKTETDFYRIGQSYFGKINGIVVSDGDNITIDTVEATGANRAGVFFTSLETSTSGKRAALIRHEITEDQVPTGDNNRIIYSHLHHNRVAGALFGYQRNFRADSNLLERNGHEKDGGTGYGIGGLGGSYNFGVTYTRNTTDHNYRKGLDTHEGNDILVENNLLKGDRLYGGGFSGDQFTLDKAAFRNNTIIADPTFRVDVDDGQDGSGSENYHAYQAMNLLPNISGDKLDLQSKGPGNFEFSGNVIRGIEVHNDSLGTYALVFRNREPTMDYTITMRDNQIIASSLKSLFVVVNDTRQKDGSPGRGAGTIIVSNNTAHIDTMQGVPSSLFYIAERTHNGILRGGVTVSNNRVIVKDRTDGGDIVSAEGNAKTYEVSNNLFEVRGALNSPTLITVNGQGATEKPVAIIKNNTFITDRNLMSGPWLVNSTRNGGGAVIQSSNNVYRSQL